MTRTFRRTWRRGGGAFQSREIEGATTLLSLANEREKGMRYWVTIYAAHWLADKGAHPPVLRALIG